MGILMFYQKAKIFELGFIGFIMVVFQFGFKKTNCLFQIKITIGVK